MARRRKGRPVNGVLVLDKPLHVSSNGALQHIKRALNAQKAGHTGALDPLASGVLPICFGEATKFSSYLLDADKCYDCTVVLGETRNTGDGEGEIISEVDASDLSESQVLSALAAFRGEIEQVPPMHSALKKDGKPLYELAREGVEIEREARRVVIHNLELNAFRAGIKAEIDISVRCSKGTYIRSLAEDIGTVLNVGGCVKVLRRTQSGPYSLAQAVSVEEIDTLVEQRDFETLNAKLLAVETPLLHFPEVVLDPDTSFYVKRGNPVQVSDSPLDGKVRLRCENDGFLGIGEILDDGRIAPRRLVQAV